MSTPPSTGPEVRAVGAKTFAAQLPRIVTGFVLAALLVVCLAMGGVYVRTALFVVSALALYEFFQMFQPGASHVAGKLFGFFVCAALFCPVTQREPVVVGVVLVLAFMWSALSFLVDYGRGNDGARFENHAVLPLGVLYIPAILQLALYLSVREQLLVVLVAVVSDTAAYYTGSAWGKHRIWPRVSPKKSWEGTLGGFFAGVAVTTAVACVPVDGHVLHGGNWMVWMAVGALLNIAAQFGDFFESALKRSRGVKDSGSILPGHGGVLDRIDSIVFALAAYSAVRLVLVHGPAFFERLMNA